MIIGDVSGKGSPQLSTDGDFAGQPAEPVGAGLRSARGVASSLNRLFYDNTGESAYASLFFADYDEASGRLRYVNCGHLSGLLVRTDGGVDRLEFTSTLIGLFREVNCSIRDQELSPGDVLALYTDGITEASNERGEEFGERPLIESFNNIGTCRARLC